MASFVPFDDARTLLLAANIVPANRIAWPNEISANPEPPCIWLAVEATSHILDPLDIGANAWREEGTIYFNVMVPAGWGTDDARKTAKLIANVYRGLPPRLVTYRGASIGHGNLSDTEGMVWTITVSIDYVYDDIGISPTFTS